MYDMPRAGTAPTPRTRPWTAGQKWLVAGLVVLCFGIAVPAFVSIFHTATTLERPYLGRLAWTVPVSAEIAFVFAFLCGALLTWRKAPAGAVRSLIMTAIAAASIALQVYAGHRSFPDALGHLVIVGSFFGVIVIGKATIMTLCGGKVKADRIPLGRWLAAPIRTAKVQRRMWLLGETSWRRMSAIEDARAVALDVVRELGADGRVAPAYLTTRMAAGRLPGQVLDAIDAALQYGSRSTSVDIAVREWVTSQMALPEQAKASLDQALRDIAQETSEPAPETSPEPLPEPTPQTSSQPPGGKVSQPPARTAPRKPSAKAVKPMSGRDLGPYVRTLLADRPDLVPAAVMKELRIGRPKAEEALAAARELAEDEDHVADVVQLGQRQEAGAR
jgi:hypothetical protein